MSNFYQVQFALCDSSTTLKSKPLQAVMFNATRELTGLTADQFSELHVIDQVDFFRWITRQCSLCDVWLKTEADSVSVSASVFSHSDPLERVRFVQPPRACKAEPASTTAYSIFVTSWSYWFLRPDERICEGENHRGDHLRPLGGLM